MTLLDQTRMIKILSKALLSCKCGVRKFENPLMRDFINIFWKMVDNLDNLRWFDTL